MENIDYGGFYGVYPGETDFSGAIKRLQNKGVQHISNDFVNMVNKIKYERIMEKTTKMLSPKVHTANSLLDRISNIFYDIDKYISSNPDWVYYFFNPYEENSELSNYIVEHANDWKDNITLSIDEISGNCVKITINIDDGSEEGIRLKRYIYLSIFEENVNRNKKIYEGKYKEIKINNLKEDITRLAKILNEKENELKTLEEYGTVC